MWHRTCIEGVNDETYGVLKRNEKKEPSNGIAPKQCVRAVEKFLSGMAHLEAELCRTNQKASDIENV